jgi:hypothetical protein
MRTVSTNTVYGAHALTFHVMQRDVPIYERPDLRERNRLQAKFLQVNFQQSHPLRVCHAFPLYQGGADRRP